MVGVRQCSSITVVLSLRHCLITEVLPVVGG